MWGRTNKQADIVAKQTKNGHSGQTNSYSYVIYVRPLTIYFLFVARKPSIVHAGMT